MITRNGDSTKTSPLVDRTQGRLLPAPRTARPNRHEMHFPVHCANPTCKTIRWLTKSNAEKAEAENRLCRKCQASAAGKKGYAATVAAYGRAFALNAVRASQLANPSSDEVIVHNWLDELALPFNPQVIFVANDATGASHQFIIDFVVQTPAGDVAVEVNGYHHKKLRALRDYWLVQLYPGEVLFIDTDDIHRVPDEVKEMLCRVAKGGDTHRLI